MKACWQHDSAVNAENEEGNISTSYAEYEQDALKCQARYMRFRISWSRPLPITPRQGDWSAKGTLHPRLLYLLLQCQKISIFGYYVSLGESRVLGRSYEFQKAESKRRI